MFCCQTFPGNINIFLSIWLDLNLDHNSYLKSLTTPVIWIIKNYWQGQNNTAQSVYSSIAYCVIVLSFYSLEALVQSSRNLTLTVLDFIQEHQVWCIDEVDDSGNGDVLVMVLTSWWCWGWFLWCWLVGVGQLVLGSGRCLWCCWLVSIG